MKTSGICYANQLIHIFVIQNTETWLLKVNRECVKSNAMFHINFYYLWITITMICSWSGVSNTGKRGTEMILFGTLYMCVFHEGYISLIVNSVSGFIFFWCTKPSEYIYHGNWNIKIFNEGTGGLVTSIIALKRKPQQKSFNWHDQIWTLLTSADYAK